jgi:hypothetical protein
MRVLRYDCINIDYDSFAKLSLPNRTPTRASQIRQKLLLILEDRAEYDPCRQRRKKDLKWVTSEFRIFTDMFLRRNPYLAGKQTLNGVLTPSCVQQ